MEAPEPRSAYSLDDLLYEKGCASLLEFKSVPVRAFEVWVLEVRVKAHTRCDTGD
jgi:hypothetical protein